VGVSVGVDVGVSVAVGVHVGVSVGVLVAVDVAAGGGQPAASGQAGVDVSVAAGGSPAGQYAFAIGAVAESLG
jgi:hypothetical protein